MLSVTSESMPAHEKLLVSLQQISSRPCPPHEVNLSRTRSRVIPFLLCEPAVDHVFDARDCDRRLGDVGSEDDFARPWRRGEEGFRLFGGVKFGVEGGDDELSSQKTIDRQAENEKDFVGGTVREKRKLE